jgi:hypothetical protein
VADPERDYADAERLMREAEEAARQAAMGGEVPPRGWSVPGADQPPPFDLGQLAALIEALRGVVPSELSQQLAHALRELLIALRAVLDWYIARLEPAERPAREMQDIPVE